MPHEVRPGYCSGQPPSRRRCAQRQRVRPVLAGSSHHRQSRGASARERTGFARTLWIVRIQSACACMPDNVVMLSAILAVGHARNISVRLVVGWRVRRSGHPSRRKAPHCVQDRSNTTHSNAVSVAVTAGTQSEGRPGGTQSGRHRGDTVRAVELLPVKEEAVHGSRRVLVYVEVRC